LTAGGTEPVPATNAMTVVTAHPVFTEWQAAIETSGVIFHASIPPIVSR
jgi:hypothetical protein